LIKDTQNNKKTKHPHCNVDTTRTQKLLNKLAEYEPKPRDCEPHGHRNEFKELKEKHLAAKINLSSSARILLASTLAAAITYIATSQLSQSPWIVLIIGTLIFLATYTVAAPLTGAINKTDIQNLKETLEGFGPLSYILKTPLNIIERLIIIFQKS